MQINYKWLLRKLLPIIFIASLLLLLKVFFKSSYPDFSVYYFAAKSALLGHNPYIQTKGYFTSFAYPPSVLFVFFPFVLFPFQVAQRVWLFISFIFLFASIYLILKIINKPIFSTQGLFIMTLTFLFFPLKFTLGMGQINLLSLFLLTLVIFARQKGKNTLAGVFLGMSILLKLFPILLILYFLLTRQRRILFITVITIVTGIIISFIFIKPQIIFYFLFHVFPSITTGWQTDYYNQALSGFLGREIGNLMIRQILRLSITLVLIFAAFAIIYKARKRKVYFPNLEIGLILTLSIITNVFSWQHHFVWILLPLVLTFEYFCNNTAGWKSFVLLGISYFLMAINFANPTILPTPVRSHVFFGALLLFILQLREIYGYANLTVKNWKRINMRANTYGSDVIKQNHYIISDIFNIIQLLLSSSTQLPNLLYRVCR